MDKNLLYEKCVLEIKSVVEEENNFIANMANCTSLFYHEFIENKYPINWFGFYLLNKEKTELTLGPFHGKLACTRIKVGKGVCGTCVERKSIIVVPDVHKFKGHIACDSASNSEICVPLFKGDEIIGLIDVDSTEFNQFSEEIDGKYLRQVAEIIANASDLSNF
ncbi:hypothetical protein ABK040_008626 [Willaertia magna]